MACKAGGWPHAARPPPAQGTGVCVGVGPGGRGRGHLPTRTAGPWPLPGAPSCFRGCEQRLWPEPRKAASHSDPVS